MGRPHPADDSSSATPQRRNPTGNLASQIPQADEQQAPREHDRCGRQDARSASLVSPAGRAAAVVMTGDDHGSGGTRTLRHEIADSRRIASSPIGMRAQYLVCLHEHASRTRKQRAMSARFRGRITLRQLRGLDPEHLADFYSTQLADWRAKYTASVTVSNGPLIAESDYQTQPHVELANASASTRTTTTGHRGGFRTARVFPAPDSRCGSPTLTGLDRRVQAATQIDDESGQTYPRTSTPAQQRDGLSATTACYSKCTRTMHRATAATQFIASRKRTTSPSPRSRCSTARRAQQRVFGAITSQPCSAVSCRRRQKARGIQAMLPMTATAVRRWHHHARRRDVRSPRRP